MSRGLALAVAGLWLGLVVASWMVAGATFRTVDRVLGPEARPEVDQRLGSVPRDDRRVVLRHLASEVNRWMFGRFGIAQVLLAVALVALVWPARGTAFWLVGGAALLLVVQAAALAPGILELGRSIDFVPRPLPPDVARRFGMLHAAYVVADLAKAGLLAAAVLVMARKG